MIVCRSVSDIGAISVHGGCPHCPPAVEGLPTAPFAAASSLARPSSSGLCDGLEAAPGLDFSELMWWPRHWGVQRVEDEINFV